MRICLSLYEKRNRENDEKQENLGLRKLELPEVKDSSTLVDLAGPRSGLLFDLVGVSTEFLGKHDWYLTAQFKQLNVSPRNLTATNDSAKRAI